MKKLLMLMVLGLPNLINAAYVIIDNQSDDEIKAIGKIYKSDAIFTTIKPHSQGHLESGSKIYQVSISTIPKPKDNNHAATPATIEGPIADFIPKYARRAWPGYYTVDNYTIIVTRNGNTYDLKIK